MIMSTMKRISNIMYIIAMVVAIIGIVSCAIYGILDIIYGITTFAGGSVRLPFYYRWLFIVLEEYAPEVGDWIYYYLGASLILSGLAFFVSLAVNIVCLVFIKLARRENASFAIHVATAAIGYFANIFALVGGILGAIDFKRAAKRKAKENVVDVESKEKKE